MVSAMAVLPMHSSLCALLLIIMAHMHLQVLKGLYSGCDSPGCAPGARAAHLPRPKAVMGEPRHFDKVRCTLAYTCWGKPYQNLAQDALVAGQNLPPEKALSYPVCTTWIWPGLGWLRVQPLPDIL